jgi:predicted alpha/beta-fold hydrolase
MVLKLAGEYGENPPKEVAGACVISPSVDLRASTDLILKRSNWLYHKSFVRSMKARMRRKNRLQPGLFDASQMKKIRTIKDFDERVTAVANGFADANDYYAKESATRVVNQIRVPTLIIHAQDDPFIPFEPLSQSGFVENSHLLLIKTTHGGHVAFVGTNKSEDRFWAENRVIEFCQLREKDLTTSGSV